MKTNDLLEESDCTEAIQALLKKLFSCDIQVYIKSEDLPEIQRNLPVVASRIQQGNPSAVHAVFMPRNEEEIVRNVLSLSTQIKFVRDIPQVIISFDEQTSNSLFFQIILVRLVEPKTSSMEELFKANNSFLHYIHDRTRSLGFLRKKHLKEATVFRVELSKDPYLRGDGSVNLNKARLDVNNELTRVAGEVRDYNGGMISKQNELFNRIHKLLGEHAKFNELLLENFFFSLMPVIMRSVMQPKALKTLFLMNLEAIEKGFYMGEDYLLKLKCDGDYVFVMIKALDMHIKEELSRLFAKLQVPTTDLTQTFVSVNDACYLGYIYHCEEPEKQKIFCYTIQNILQACNL